MGLGNIYTLADAQRLTGETRPLITFLIHDREIPNKAVGSSTVIDDKGLAMLKEAIAGYRRKAGPIDKSPGRTVSGDRRRKPATATAS